MDSIIWTNIEADKMVGYAYWMLRTGESSYSQHDTGGKIITDNVMSIPQTYHSWFINGINNRCRNMEKHIVLYK